MTQPLLYGIFSKTFDMSIQAAFIVPIILLVRFFLKASFGKSAIILWFPFLFRLLCPVSLAIPVSIMAWGPYSTQRYFPSSSDAGGIVFSELDLVSPKLLANGNIGHIVPYVWLLFFALITGALLFRFYRSADKKRNVKNTLLHILCAFYWYNPIIFFCSRLIEKEYETVRYSNAANAKTAKAGLVRILTLILAIWLTFNPLNNADTLSPQNVTKFQSSISTDSDFQEYILHTINTAKRWPLFKDEASALWYGDTTDLCELKVKAPQSSRVLEYDLFLYHQNGYHLFYSEIEYGAALRIRKEGVEEKIYKLSYETADMLLSR